jgi:hypothetical protein
VGCQRSQEPRCPSASGGRAVARSAQPTKERQTRQTSNALRVAGSVVSAGMRDVRTGMRDVRNRIEHRAGAAAVRAVIPLGVADRRSGGQEDLQGSGTSYSPGFADLMPVPNSIAFNRPGPSSRPTALKAKNGISWTKKITATVISPARPPPPITGTLAVTVSPSNNPMTTCSARHILAASQPMPPILSPARSVVPVGGCTTLPAPVCVHGRRLRSIE